MCDPDPSITLTRKSKPRRVAFKTHIFWNIFLTPIPVTGSPEQSCVPGPTATTSCSARRRRSGVVRPLR